MTSVKRPLASRIMAAQNKVFDRMRHRQASAAARQEGTAQDFDHFRGWRQALVVTFKRSGEPVPTPVNFGLSSDGRLYFRSEPDVAKIKRLRREPRVRVCPCNLRGKPLGPMVEARARVLREEEEESARSIIAANWRFDSKLVERAHERMGVAEVYVELTPERAELP